jgi:hypothetical protein
MAKIKSELVAAAVALETELLKFDDGVSAFTKLSLTSKKALDRASKMLEQLAASEQAMGVQIQALVQAVAAARESQGARVVAVREKGEELKARALEFRDLIGECEALGAAAGGLNEKLQGAGPSVVDVAHELDALRAKAESLNARAKEKSFDDLAHLADTLRQQLQSLAVRLGGGAGRAS